MRMDDPQELRIMEKWVGHGSCAKRQTSTSIRPQGLRDVVAAGLPAFLLPTANPPIATTGAGEVSFVSP